MPEAPTQGSDYPPHWQPQVSMTDLQSIKRYIRVELGSAESKGDTTGCSNQQGLSYTEPVAMGEVCCTQKEIATEKQWIYK